MVGPLQVGEYSVIPFVALLLAIAFLPLVAEHFWHSNRNRFLVSAGCALPVVAYLILGFGADGTHALLHVLQEYASFIILLASLYTVAGGLLVDLNARPTPWLNALLLALGAVLANVIGTTGASVVLIRPFLRINQPRQRNRHLPVFFIFIVSNLGGLLTPLGDPPLLLGFLRGVDFFWTLRLWPEWLTANAIVLAVFLVWDTLAYQREVDVKVVHEVAAAPRVRLVGLVNLVLLLGILLAVLLQSEKISGALRDAAAPYFACPSLQLVQPWGEVSMVALALLSLLLTPRGVRAANGFHWAAIIEVAVLFVGIFVTMVPALELLKLHRGEIQLTEPWQYFWLTGTLSAFLDNAPTYLIFATLAAGSDRLHGLQTDAPLLLAAISCGAVMMGAMTYIGNGPNFMVKAIAEESGYQTPSFFGYMVYSILILVPTFVLVMLLEFTPNLNF